MNNGANRGNEIKNKLAKKAVTAAGGPVAGKALDIADKLGKKNGNFDLMNRNKKDDVSDDTSSSSTATDSELPVDGENTESSKKNSVSDLASSGLSNLKNRFFGNGDQESNATGNIVSNLFQKHSKPMAIGILSVSIIALVFIIMIPILIATPGIAVDEFFTGIGDAIVGFFHIDEQQRMDQYYEKLEKVQTKINKKKGVCIDVNLITATLTVDLDAAGYIAQSYDDTKELEESDEDSFPITESGASDGWEGFIDDSSDFDYISETEDQGEKYKKMTKEVELLANMQIKTIKYGHNKKLKNNGEGVVIPVDKHGNPKLAVNYANKCWAEDSEYEDEPVSEETLEDFDLPGFDAWTDWNINGDFTSDSPDKVAMHDKKAFYKFFAKKAKEETNYQFTIYNPKIETSCDDETGECEQVCNWRLPKNQYELSIGDLNTMEHSVYYWNLVNSFIPNYYQEYLPAEGHPEREEAIKGIAELIYLLYNDLGPNHTCKSVEDYTTLCDENNYSSEYVDEYVYNPGGRSISPNKEVFFNEMSAYAIEAMSQTGINASVILGVAAHESGSGTGTLVEANNFFSIAAPCVSAKTSDYISKDVAGNVIGRQVLFAGQPGNDCTGNRYWTGSAFPMPNSDNAWWRAYSSMEDSVMDFAYMVSGINSSRYDCNSYSSPIDQVSCLIDHGYTCWNKDGTLNVECKSQYINAVMNYINDYDLTQYDIGEWDGDNQSARSEFENSPVKALNICSSSENSVSGDWANWKQMDEPWAHFTSANGTEFQWFGCYITSLAILIAKSNAGVTISSFDPGVLFNYLKDSGEIGAGGYCTGIAPISDLVPTFSINAYNQPYSVDSIRDYVNQGYYVQIRLSKWENNEEKTHFVAVDRVQGDTIYIHDPGSRNRFTMDADFGGKTPKSFNVYKIGG